MCASNCSSRMLLSPKNRYRFQGMMQAASPHTQAESSTPQEGTTGGTPPSGFIANLYYAVSAGLVAKAAGVLGYREEEERYHRLSGEQFAVVNK